MFGPTFQGEGQSTGQQALFVRLSRCNLSCSWCDTPYTWDWSRFDPHAEARRIPVKTVAAWVLASPVQLVVITGGEPLLQQPGLVPLVERLAAAGRGVEVETNGTIAPAARLTEAVGRFNVSPKLTAAGGSVAARIRPVALRAFAGCGKAVFKFVVTDPAEIEGIAELQRAYGLAPVWVMPQGITSGTVIAGMRLIADEALARGWNLSPRLHVLLWEDARGR
ncbi:MAG: 7-carboxy-7-deazaguanine synthase QueE [Egibacteraceae bacterium]